MGAFSVEVEIGDAAGRRFEPIEAIVDTGAAYTWVPRDVLARVGLRPTEERLFELADGRQVRYGFAWATIRLQGKVQPTPVVFGDPGSGPLLGVVTLEEFGLGIDPVNQRLIEVPALLKGFKP
jgi:aspartyl protease family protein